MLPSAHAMLDLEALTFNLARIRECAPKSKVMAVIKANAYGHGAIAIARALKDADAFAVARLDEGVALRDAGIRQRVAVLQGFVCQEELAMLALHHLEPVIHTARQIELLESTPLKQPVTVWLKLDSGMHRLGFAADEFVEGYRRLSRCATVSQPPFLMTHLANADVPGDAATDRQLDLFNEQSAILQGECSIANSAGLLSREDVLAKWVRPGIAIYGVSPFVERSGADDGLRPVMTLRTRLIAIKHLKAGDAVGYGGEYVCERDTLVGVAAIGYGDGYPRYARSGTPVLLRGRRVPLIGRVSMDMITIGLDGCAEAEVGDAVTLWGAGLPVEEVARHADTIPYVLLCNVTPRVKRIECRGLV